MIRVWPSDFCVQTLGLREGEKHGDLSFSLPRLISLVIVEKDALGQLDSKFMSLSLPK